MARTVGPSSMLDLRSVSILFAHDYANREGIPFQPDTETLPLRDRKSFDSLESWNLLGYAVGLGSLTLGILHSCAFLGSFAPPSYQLSVLQTTLISAGMYATFILFSPLGCSLVKSWGPQLTATAGLLLGFAGLFSMALQVHWILHVVANVVFLGIGVSFVQTAATCCVVDFFKTHISVAMIILSLISPLGIIIFVSFSYFVGIKGLTAHRWIMVCYAMMFVTAIGMTRRLPKSIRIPGHQDSIRAEEIAQRIKECLKHPPKVIDPCGYPPQVQDPRRIYGEFACTCACVINCALLKHYSFFLWGAICFCAMLTFYVPMVLIVPYVKFEFNYGYLDALQFICIYCASSIASRVVVFLLHEFTFFHAKLFLQAGLVVNGLIYGFLYTAETFGWVLAVCFGLGVTEGVFVVMIPRLTFLVFPSNRLASAWQTLMLLQSLGVFIGPTFIVLLRRDYGGEILLPCVILGAFQIIAAILTFLLPKSKERQEPDEVKCPPNSEPENSPNT